tara:strand:- start:146 stop:652 length:507 start_codon:yes stop_codon:yes gene_type:complete
MAANFQKILAMIILLLSYNSFASSLAEDAKNRGINETCSNYLGQIESSYELNGLNITFAHPDNPSKFPSLHISSQKYNNGSSSFSATLTPDGDYCYLSTVMTTAINNQSCSEIVQIKVSNDENLKASNFAEGKFIILTPKDNAYQTILTSSGEYSCTITESRMMWPGR